MHNGLHSLPGRSVHRKAAGGWQPDWVSFPRNLGGSLGDGSGLHRLSKLTGQGTTFSSMTFVARVRRPKLDERNRLFSHESTGAGVILAGSGWSSTSDSNPRSVGFSGFDASPAVQFNHGRWATLSEDPREYVLAGTLDGVSGAMQTAILTWEWKAGEYTVGGVVPQPITYPTPGMDLDGDYWSVGGSNYHYGGDMAYFWLRYAADSSAYVDLTSAALRAELRGNPEDWTMLTSPDIWFQGPAAEWNSGVNRGSGGDFYVNTGSEVTDAPRVTL